MAKVNEFKFFPGCFIGNRVPFLEASARKVFDKLGIKISDAPFACCPDPVGQASTDHLSWLTLGAYNLTIAEAEGKDIMSICNGCFQTLKLVNQELKHDDHGRHKTNEILRKIGKEYKGIINVRHFVEVLYEIGKEKINSHVVNDLSALKVACHTGCHYMRPSDKVQTDDPMKPIKLRALVQAVGATPVEYDTEVICCGAGTEHAESEPAIAILAQKYKSAVSAGAEAFIVNCPQCFQQFDSKLRDLEKYTGIKYTIPVLYITELMALAYGFEPDELGLNFHRARLTGLLEKYNLK